VAAIPLYDVYVTTKRNITADLNRAGARRVTWVPFAYEPTLHYPEGPASEDEWQKWGSDVVFVGGADADRVPFFRRLASDPTLRLRLFGGYWGRYRELRPAWGGFVLGRDYRLALGGSKIAPCLVRRANRDGHVMRSFEVPACGAFLLAERTEEHLELFEEGKEMASFASPEELEDKVRYYVTHESQRRRIAEAGHRRVTGGGNAYRDRLIELLRQGAAARVAAP
jgi:spore maturation protein CgeB